MDQVENLIHNRATNAAAESFNAKIKAFRNALRGVRDVQFFFTDYTNSMRKIFCYPPSFQLDPGKP